MAYFTSAELPNRFVYYIRLTRRKVEGFTPQKHRKTGPQRRRKLLRRGDEELLEIRVVKDQMTIVYGARTKAPARRRNM
jgi:hypothetical protein